MPIQCGQMMEQKAGKMDGRRPNIPGLALCLLALVTGLGTIELAKGGFYIGKHEGDTIHLAELVLRMANGEWPHRDFMTPIGILAIAPMALFVALGQGFGHAIFWSQILVALILLPATLWVASSRLRGIWPWIYGGFVMVLCLALVHGEANMAVSISMHYNRWAWAIVYLMVPLVMIAPARERPLPDGLVLGLGAAALLLIKVTYGAVLPAILIALIARRSWRTLAVATVAALAAAAVLTLVAGPDFWLAYLADLRAVASTDVRPNPGEPLSSVLASPQTIGANLALIAAVIFLRQSGRMTEGMVLLFLMPGFFYITYQNYGNDPQWLWLLAILIASLRPEAGTLNGRGWDMHRALGYVVVLSMAFGLGSALNLAYSPLRHLAIDGKKMVPLLSGLPAHHDIFAEGDRLYGANVNMAADLPGSPYAAYRPRADRKDIESFGGQDWGDCEMSGGMNAYFEVVAKDLAESGYAGKSIGAMDLFSGFWMFGNVKPVRGAAPWNYGEPSGLGNADYVVLPLCPFATQIESGLLKSMGKDGWTFEVVRKTPVYWLLAVKSPSTP